MTDGPDPLASLLRDALTPHDVAADRAAAVRTAARSELRHAVRPFARTRRALEATATFALGVSQVAWMISSLYGQR